MECPSCGLDVLVHDGVIDTHLRPDTLEQCSGKAKSEPKAEAHKAAEPKKAPAKAPAKAKAAPKTAVKDKH